MPRNTRRIQKAAAKKLRRVVAERAPARPKAPPATEIHTNVIDVSPELAARWLERNAPHNRIISPRKVEHYARQMAADQWMLTHQSIAFDVDGLLVDGQHRLSAIVQSGKTIRMVVADNVAREAFGAMDVGFRRSVADLAAEEWITRETVANARAMFNGCASLKANISEQELLAFIRFHEKPLRFVSSLPHTRRSGAVHLTAPVFGALARAWYYAEEDRLTRFLDVLRDGVATAPAEAVIMMLRDQIVSGIMKNKSQDMRRILNGRTQRIIRAFLDGEPLVRMPTPIDDLFRLPEEVMPDDTVPYHTEAQ